MKDVRPRAWCPGCGRSIAVTFDKGTGEAYLRPHNQGTGSRYCGATCKRSGTVVPRTLFVDVLGRRKEARDDDDA